MTLGLRHDGSIELLKTFTKQGCFQYSETALAKGDVVTVVTLLQKNYEAVDKESISLNKSEALELARNIIKHYGDEA